MAHLPRGPLRVEDLTPIQLRVIDALIDSLVAWESPSRLSVVFGLDVELVEDALADLDAAGWIQHWEEAAGMLEPWNPAAGPCATFTPPAVEALGIRLVEEGDASIPRWARPGEEDTSPPKALGVFREYESLDLAVDRNPGPLVLAILEEGILAAIAMGWPDEAERQRKRDARAAVLRHLRAREARRERRKARYRIDNLEFTPVFEGPM